MDCGVYWVDMFVRLCMFPGENINSVKVYLLFQLETIISQIYNYFVISYNSSSALLFFFYLKVNVYKKIKTV